MRKYLESFLWLAGLLALYFMHADETHFSLCLFRWMGFESCFGCGIGHAIHHALHLDLQQSFEEHPLGIPAVLVLFWKIFSTFLPSTQNNKRGSTKNLHDVPGFTTGRINGSSGLERNHG